MGQYECIGSPNDEMEMVLYGKEDMIRVVYFLKNMFFCRRWSHQTLNKAWRRTEEAWAEDWDELNTKHNTYSYCQIFAHCTSEQRQKDEIASIESPLKSYHISTLY